MQFSTREQQNTMAKDDSKMFNNGKMRFSLLSGAWRWSYEGREDVSSKFDFRFILFPIHCIVFSERLAIIWADHIKINLFLQSLNWFLNESSQYLLDTSRGPSTVLFTTLNTPYCINAEQTFTFIKRETRSSKNCQLKTHYRLH